MAGGTWNKQDKVRAGAYINFKDSKGETSLTSDRGIVGLPLVLPFGPEKQIIELNADTDLFNTIGLEIGEDSLLMLKEALKKAQKVLIYRLNKGTKASKTLSGLSVTAKWSGIKGNNITIVIETNIDDTNTYDVSTYAGDKKVDSQTVKTIDELTENTFVTFSGTGALSLSAGFKLENGTDGTVIGQDYSDFLSQLELHEFNTFAVPCDDSAVKLVVKEFVKRLREDEGKRVQAVLPNFKEADNEGIISVNNGVYIESNIHIDNIKATAYIAAVTASAGYGVSNTYKTYEDAMDVDVRYSNKDIINIINDGEIVFVLNNQKVVIEQDINTFKSITDEKGKEVRKNRVIRVLDGINNLIKSKWEETYIGNQGNTEDGRNLFKKDVLKILETLQAEGALENVTVDDIEILKGTDSDSVVANVAAKPVDAMEKLYMTVII